VICTAKRARAMPRSPSSPSMAWAMRAPEAPAGGRKARAEPADLRNQLVSSASSSEIRSFGVTDGI